MISIITPWYHHPEFIGGFENAVANQGAQVIVIDNGNEAELAAELEAMCGRLGGLYIRSDTNIGYSRANNLGMSLASGETIVFLNNDIYANGAWVHLLDNLPAGLLYGTSLGMRYVDGICVPYLEGWCLIGRKADFGRIGGWRDDWKGLYWEDNEICFRASCAGLGLRQINLPLVHISNGTKMYEYSASNQAEFERVVREYRAALEAE